MLKTDYCGELGARDAGRTVTLAGWVHRRRDHGGLIFIDLRDSTGLVQVVFNPNAAGTAHAVAEGARSEYVLRLSGAVAPRPAGTENAAMATGEVEVQATEVEVLNAAKTPPFYINEEQEVDEQVRLRYRYLDLRRPVMHERLVLRYRTIAAIRRYMDGQGFIEVETPILMKATPEGARDFIVPSRLNPGEFYALPQSPQQLKQLLMVAGVERYYQIARCFRDEDLRADRQLEFTQLDLEMSFVEEEDIYRLMEGMFTAVVGEVGPQFAVESPWPRYTYAEVMERFGSDKPDLRYGLELRDFSDLLGGTEFGVFRSALEAGGRVRGLAIPGGAEFTRRQIDELTEVAKQAGAKGLVTVGMMGEGPLGTLTAEEIRSPVARFLTPELVGMMAERCGAGWGDMLLIVADAPETTSAVLDVLRREVARRLELADPNRMQFAFVTDFPLFGWDEEGQRWDSVHHLFTSAVGEDVALLDTDPGRVRARAYDVVCNGYELGGGSIRIHEREMQEKIFSLLRIAPEVAQDRFGHMLEAFEYGAPPHGGFAAGLDRVVMLLAGATSIREVIPFPKTQSGQDLMMGAPSTVTAEQMAELSIRAVRVEGGRS